MYPFLVATENLLRPPAVARLLRTRQALKKIIKFIRKPSHGAMSYDLLQARYTLQSAMAFVLHFHLIWLFCTRDRDGHVPWEPENACDDVLKEYILFEVCRIKLSRMEAVDQDGMVYLVNGAGSVY